MLSISDIENWLRDYGISNYHISEDFLCFSSGNVNLSEKLKVKTSY